MLCTPVADALGNMNKSSFLFKIIRPISALVIVTILVSIIPQPSRHGCPYVGPCHPVFIMFSAGLFVFVSLILGPKNITYYLFVLLLLVSWCALEPLNTGELTIGKIWEIYLFLKHSFIFSGGVIGFIFGYIVIFTLGKFENA